MGKIKYLAFTAALSVCLQAQYTPPPGSGGGGGGGSVTSVSCGTGLSGGTITTTGTCAVIVTAIGQKFFGTSAPTSPSGNLPGDTFSDTTNFKVYGCTAPSGTSAPACTAVGLGNWVLLNILSPTITAFVDPSSSIQTQLNAKAPLVSPSFTTPALGTPSSGNLANTTGYPAAALPTITLTGDTTGAASGGSIATTVAVISAQSGTNALTSRHSIGVHLGCGQLDNAICTSAVDASGNPNFLATASNTVLPINGGTTALVMYIAGAYQILSSNVTLTVPSTASVQQWILAKQDTTNAAMVAGDFLAMNTAPFYSYTAPTCPSPSPSLSSTNPSFWFDLSTGIAKLCTSNGGSYSQQNSMVIGTVFVDATPKVLAVLGEPFRLNAYARFQMFGSGVDGALAVTSSTTTINRHFQYQAVSVTGGTLTASANTSASVGVSFSSQSPVFVLNSASITATGLTGTTRSATTGAGAAGSVFGTGGAGGGGGGSGTTSAAGGGGGGRMSITGTGLTGGGGTAGAATPTAGGVGQAALSPASFWSPAFGCAGSQAGSGAGDGTNIGGVGGAAGGLVFIRAPSIFLASSASVTANGNNGGNSAGGNAGGGGGAGGGCVILDAGFINNAGATLTANGGSGGSASGTGQTGGTGGAGIVQTNKLW